MSESEGAVLRVQSAEFPITRCPTEGCPGPVILDDVHVRWEGAPLRLQVPLTIQGSLSCEYSCPTCRCSGTYKIPAAGLPRRREDDGAYVPAPRFDPFADAAAVEPGPDSGSMRSGTAARGKEGWGRRKRWWESGG